MDPAEKLVEIYNPLDRPVPLGGWFLGTSRADLASLLRVPITTAGIVVPAGGYRALTAAELLPDACDAAR